MLPISFDFDAILRTKSYEMDIAKLHFYPHPIPCPSPYRICGRLSESLLGKQDTQDTQDKQDTQSIYALPGLVSLVCPVCPVWSR